MANPKQSLVTRQPGKALWVLYALASTTLRLPLWLIYYIFKANRQHPRWTYTQAIKSYFVKNLVYHITVTESPSRLSLKPGIEKERFVVIQPAKEELYKGVANSSVIRPEPVGGTWFPSLFEAQTDGFANIDVVLHLHGGAFVLGDGRIDYSGFQASLLTKNLNAKVLSLQYRLASDSSGKFPAALQDTISAYLYLLGLGIPASNIILSGDSAGANLALALLRYIADNENALPWPAAAWLWCPWVDLATSLELDKLKSIPNVVTDNIPMELLTWGARAYIPESMDPSNPYLSPINHPFACKTPMWVSVGTLEALYDDGVKLVTDMKGVEGNRVELWQEEATAHDIFLMGKLTGFEEQADKLALRAVDFLKENRLK
jgi:acetyl esterase/lipase